MAAQDAYTLRPSQQVRGQGHGTPLLQRVFDIQSTWSVNQWVDEIPFLELFEILVCWVVIYLNFICVSVQNGPHLISPS